MATNITEGEAVAPGGTSNFALWFGMLGGATAWLIHLQAAFVLVPWYCARHQTWPLHLLTIALLGFTFVAGVVSVSEWRRSPRAHEYLEARADRARFMAVLGALLSALFFLVILAQWIPVFVIDPCQS